MRTAPVTARSIESRKASARSMNSGCTVMPSAVPPRRAAAIVMHPFPQPISRVVTPGPDRKRLRSA
jgi:hypothetical protein